MIGLGRMGLNMARRLLRGGHEVVAYNRTPQKAEELAGEGGQPAYSLREVVERLPAPRVLWIMLPAGSAVDDHLAALKDLLAPGDLVIEGGNTFYKDDLRRAVFLAKHDIRYLDAGVSGGIWGLKAGYCLMIGGPREAFDQAEPLFQALAPPEGYLYCGPTGSGHFLKMVHNGIEYALMQAYGEGFQVLEASPYAENLNYQEVAHLWNRGSVIRSWLLELAEAAFARDGRLEDLKGIVEDSGEGRWTMAQALETGVPVPVIALSLMARFRSRETDTFSDRLVAALRREFGGHAVQDSNERAGNP
jgi:6-phosphogluconate dehydrogenase